MSFRGFINKFKNKRRPLPLQGQSGTGRSGADDGDDESTNSRPRPSPHVGVLDSGGDGIDPRVGESDDNLIDSDRGGAPPGENQQNAAIGHRGEDSKAIAAAAAKALLRGVRDSADAFPPLKSVVGGLCFILDNYEQTQGNRQAIGSLTPRVKSLADSLRAPVPEGDTGEGPRRKILERKLESISTDITLVKEQGKVEAFLNNTGNANKLRGIVEDIRDAIMDYQTSLQQDIYYKSLRLIASTDLALLNGMYHASDAGFSSGNRQGCLSGTRIDVLWKIDSWLADETDRRVFWLNGLAGTGKSTIAQTFAETSFAGGDLGASFFCSRDFADRSGIRNIFPTLAFQLAFRYPEFRQELLPVLMADPEPGRGSLCSQLEKLIIAPLKATGIQTLIIIDALDECKDEEPASAILSVLSRYVDQVPRVKFFITGRPEPRIRSGFRLEPLRPITEVLKLQDVEGTSVDTDIKLFLETMLTRIAKSRSDWNLKESWPSSYDIDVLCKKSAGLFIYASTIVKFIAAPYDLPTDRLTLIISLRQSTAHEGKSGIDILYAQVLEQAFQGADPDAEELYSRFKLVVGTVLLAFHPLSGKTLSELLREHGAPLNISNALRSLHSLLLVPDSEVAPIRTFHKSFPDFLTDKGRCKDKRFFVDPPVHHSNIMFLCLNLMKERLSKNICDLDGFPPLSRVKDISDRRKAYIGSTLEYACRFWTKHLSEIRSSDSGVAQVKAAIDEFFKTNLLFWIEVLSLTGYLNIAVYALHDIDQWYLSTGGSCQWTSDSQRLILSSFDKIRDSPTDMYRHILPFCPLSSWLHEFYTSESLGEVKVVKGCPDKWGTCNRVVVPRGDPEALVYWKDMIAVGLRSGDIMILDAITGSSRSDFSGHEGSVVCLTFSPDGTLLVSGSVDATLRLWDIQTGGVMRTFRDKACSVAISSDAITIASGGTHTVRLWEVRTGACHRTIDVTPGGTVACLDFLSTVPGRLMSISGGVVQQWDVNGTETGPKFSGHHISFSSDGKHFVLCDEGPPTIRDTVSGKTIATLLSTGRDFSLCCFSPGDQFVAGVANETVYVWDITDTPLLIETFTPHSSSIFSLVYSPSLVSTHSDGGIRFQRIYGGSLDSTTNKTKSMATSRARIIYTTLQAEKGIAISVDSAGTIERWDLSTGLPEVLLRVPGTEHVIGARLADSELTIVHRDHSFDSGWRVSTWDVGSGKMLRGKSLSGDVSTLDPTLNRDLGISKDGKTFFVVDPVNIRTWSISTGESTGSSSHRSYTRTSISVSLDGPIIWIRALGRSQAWGWDSRDLKAPPLDTSEIPKTLRLACPHARGDGGSSGQSRIVDTTSGAEVFRLSEGFKNPGKAVWDGRYLCVGYGDGELLILDFVHMTLR